MCILERFFIDFCKHLWFSEICGRFPLLLEIYSPTDSTDIHRFYIFQYPCSSVLSVGDFLCCLRFILPLIPQIFTDSIYSNIRAHPRYLWETPSHPISVLIYAICGRSLLLLEIYSPTDSTDFTDFIYPCIRVHLCYLWETPSPPISVFICDICGSHPLHLKIILPQIPRIFTDASWDCSPTDSTDIHRFYIFQYPCSSALSVGDSFAPDIRVHLRYLWEPSSAS